MRMSCNGCRVLRKGCSENCSIRPCLQWIKTPESQANATVFLAKFYGRAGLMNLINSGPEHLRPAIFRSLLYEACGRIVNPIYGSVGLLWSGSWQLCQAAVEAVLKGAPIMQISSEVAAVGTSPPLKAYDIRHVSKEKDDMSNCSQASQDLRKVRNRTRFKRSGTGKKRDDDSEETWVVERAPSHESSVSHQTELNGEGCSRETDSMFSVETVEASLVNRRSAEPEPVPKFGKFEDDSGDVEVGLELTLGFEPSRRDEKAWSPVNAKTEMNESCADMCKMEVGS